MKLFFKTILITVFVFAASNSLANTLLDSLNSAYKNNSILNAERASMRATTEEKRGAASEFFPSVTISGYRSEQDNTKGSLTDSNFDPTEKSLLVEQKIFQGGAGVANYKKKKIWSKTRET
jgi:outer membrane protein TolC